MSKSAFIYAIFSGDSTKYYPIGQSDLPFQSGMNLISGNLIDTITLQFPVVKISADDLLTKTGITLYYEEDGTDTKIWDGYVLHASIFTKNGIVSVTCQDKASELLNTKVTKSGDRLELTQLLKDVLDGASISYSYLYEKPSLKYDIQMLIGEKYSGDETITTQEVKDIASSGVVGHPYVFVVLKQAILRIEFDGINIINIEKIASTDKEFGRFIRDDSNALDYMFVEVIESNQGTGTRGARQPFVSQVCYINPTTNYKVYFAQFSNNTSSSYNEHRNINTFSSDEAGYVIPNSLFHYYDSSSGVRYFVGAMQYSKDETIGSTEEINFARFEWITSFASTYDAYVCGYVDMIVMDNTACLIPCPISGKVLYYRINSDKWGEITYASMSKNDDIGYSPMGNGGLSNIQYFNYVDGDWYIINGGVLYKVYTDSAWHISSVDNADTLSVSGWGWSTGFHLGSDISFQFSTYYKGASDFAGFPINAGYLDASTPLYLYAISYKGRLFIFRYNGTPNLYMTEDVNNLNLLDLIREIALPLGMVFRYNIDTAKYEFMNLLPGLTATDTHNIDNDLIIQNTFEEYEYQTEYVDDVHVENKLREISYNQTGYKYKVVRDIQGDWESYIKNLLDFYNIKRPQYIFTMSGLFFWKVWDSVIYNMHLYRIADIRQNFKDKTTTVRIIRSFEE